MMIKVGSDYLEYNGDIDIERKVKLFEEIDSVQGDFSYQFEVQLTSNNVRVLGFPAPDNISKTVYHRIQTQILSDSGELISIGFIRIERISNGIAYCSFFSGNNSWFSMLTGNMDDLDLTEFNTDQTATTIQNSWTNESGIVFPLVDTGELSKRRYQVTKVEDYTPGIYLKDLMKKTFQSCGLKLTGELIQDDLYNKICVFSNNKSKTQTENRSINVMDSVGKLLTPSDNEKVIFDTVSPNPYYVGAENNFASSTYTADVKMNLRVNLFLSDSDSGFILIDIWRNGSFYKNAIVTGGSAASASALVRVPMEAGDTLEVYARTLGVIGGGYSRLTMEIIPSYIFAVFNDSVVPKWTKQDFVSNVLRLFCCIPSYDHYSKTVTINLFDKVKTKERIDLSEFIQITEVDYSEFISDYGKVNQLTYTESDDIDLKEYNISTFFKYGSGQIYSSNEHIEDNVTILESDFSAPISYKHQSIMASIERLNFTELVGNGEANITSVTDDSGVAKLFVDNIAPFELGGIVRISESTDSTYNGDQFVIEVGADYIKCLGLLYSTDADAKVEAMIHESTESEDVFLLVNAPNESVEDFSPLIDIYLEFTPLSTMAIAFFNMINLGEPINEKYTQGLSFGNVQDPLSYQRSLVDKYWQAFSRIVNDPVKLRFVAYLPAHIHDKMDFLRPIEIKTLESVNLYYLNLERGYKGSHVPCEGELIKLP
jgi:hypothetical protein